MKSDADQIREYVWIRYMNLRGIGGSTGRHKLGDVVKGRSEKQDPKCMHRAAL